jgi:hypothetical protein
VSAEPMWRKSLRCGPNNGCVEVAWRKSSHSNGNCACVETAAHVGVVLVRDSKHGGGSAVLTFSAAEWDAFAARVKAGSVS